jgi:prefoldin subunit 5
VDAKTLAALRQQLQKLESDLAVVDRQLAQLKGFSKGDSKNAGGLQSDTWQYNSSSVDEQLRQMQQKKSQIQAAIDNLLDAARASGVEPGQLR